MRALGDQPLPEGALPAFGLCSAPMRADDDDEGEGMGTSGEIRRKEAEEEARKAERERLEEAERRRQEEAERQRQREQRRD